MAMIVFRSSQQPMVYPPGLHILTFAEDGFSPLDIHARHFQIPRPAVCAFAESVNRNAEVGSLNPEAPISAVPRSCVRDTNDPDALIGYLTDFLDANASLLQARCLLLDFRTPNLQKHVREAIDEVFTDKAAWEFGDVIVVEN